MALTATVLLIIALYMLVQQVAYLMSDHSPQSPPSVTHEVGRGIYPRDYLGQSLQDTERAFGIPSVDNDLPADVSIVRVPYPESDKDLDTLPASELTLTGYCIAVGLAEIQLGVAPTVDLTPDELEYYAFGTVDGGGASEMERRYCPEGSASGFGSRR